MGRDYAEIEKTVASQTNLDEQTRQTRPAGLAALKDHLSELAGIGLDHVLLSPPRAWDEATLEAIAEIVPDVHAMEGTTA